MFKAYVLVIFSYGYYAVRVYTCSAEIPSNSFVNQTKGHHGSDETV